MIYETITTLVILILLLLQFELYVFFKLFIISYKKCSAGPKCGDLEQAQHMHSNGPSPRTAITRLDSLVLDWILATNQLQYWILDVLFFVAQNQPNDLFSFLYGFDLHLAVWVFVALNVCGSGVAAISRGHKEGVGHSCGRCQGT